MRAILYSGNLRTFEFCAQNHAETFGECDVYFSLWDKPGYVDRINDPWHSRMEPRYENLITEQRVRDITPKEFTIKAIKIDEYERVNITGELRKNNYLLWQYYKMKDCFELLSGDYDEIVRMRCDIMLSSFKTVPGKLNLSKYVWRNQPFDGYRMNEMIFSGNYEIMKKACRVIDNIPAINSLDIPDYLFYGESIFYQHLKMEGLLDNINLHDFGWRVLR